MFCKKLYLFSNILENWTARLHYCPMSAYTNILDLNSFLETVLKLLHLYTSSLAYRRALKAIFQYKVLQQSLKYVMLFLMAIQYSNHEKGHFNKNKKILAPLPAFLFEYQKMTHLSLR